MESSKRFKIKKLTLLLVFLSSLIVSSTYAQDGVIPVIKFKDTDIRVVLQAISEKAVSDGKKINIVASPSVEDIVSVSLENVDWLTALKVILKAYSYGYEWVGDNIILVAPLEELADRREREALSKESEPLETRAIVLKFAKVKELKDTVSKLLTERGKLTIDKRTNMLIITDTQSSLERLKSSLKALDAITPQVLIEAKIIETNLDVANKLGINWNISGIASASKRPHTWPYTKVSRSKYMTDNIPVVDGVHDELSDVFTFGTLDATSFSLALDIIFSDTNTKILSMPKLTTLNNNTATIEVVTEDPVPKYIYNVETGNWEISGFDWIKYGVSLEVTPQINQDGYITLEVKPKVSERLEDRTFTSAGSTAYIPKLYTQTTTTKVMIKDGETLAIGGLIRDKLIDKVSKIPLLGDIPILGYFFKHKYKTTEKRNLLIFITPRIVTADETMQ